MTKTTTATTTTTTIAGTNLVTAARTEFIAFAMDKVSGFTVARLENELTALNVPFRKKDIKEVKAGLLYDALEVLGKEQSAAGETPVAETKLEEETTMTTLIEKAAAIKATREAIQAAQGAARINIKNFREGEALRVGHGENPNLVEMMQKINAAKDAYFNRIGEHEIVLESVTFYEDKGNATREDSRNNRVARVNKLANGTDMHILGEVVVRLPQDFAQIKRWDKNKVNRKGTLGGPVFIDFNGYDATFTKGAYNMRAPLADGSNLIAMNIMEFISADGTTSGLQVSLPREKGKDGRYWPIFKTNDIRMIKTKDAVRKDEPMYTEDNNEQFNAAVTAMVRLFANELEVANPDNHHGFNKLYCTNMIRFGTKDGVHDDVDMESKKSKVILEQPDVMQLAQVGPEQPNRYCTVTQQWLDAEAVTILNEASQMERTYGLDENGESRFQRHNEIIWAGKLVEKNQVRDIVADKICSQCPFFCGNTPKDEEKVAKEKVEARERGASDYVNAFYREKAKPEAQAFEVLVEDASGKQQWELKFPAELEEGMISELRVKSGAMNVYASQEVLESLDLEYLPPVVAFDAEYASFTKKIDWLYAAAFRKDDLDEAQHAIVEALEKPANLTENQARRWDTAVEWYEKSKVWAEERVAQSTVKPFYKHFFTGAVASRRVYFEHFELAGKSPFITRPASMVELHVEDIMAERMERQSHSDFVSMNDLMDISGDDNGEYNARRNDYIHAVYDDLTDAEFVRYLDDNASNIVEDVVANGTFYTIVGGTEQDKELAAGALQELLQREVQWTWVNGIRRDENPIVALLNAQVSEEVKAYIVEVLGLLN